MFSKIPGLPDTVRGTVDNMPQCVSMLLEFPEYQEKLTNCIDMAEIKSRTYHGKCHSKCCLQCSQEGCINVRTKYFKDKDGKDYTKTYHSVCPVVMKGGVEACM